MTDTSLSSPPEQPIAVLYIRESEDIHQDELEQVTGDRSVTLTILESAEDALSVENLSSYDLIVSGYHLPGMDGIAFLTAIRERFGNIPVILFTGGDDETVMNTAYHQGADWFVKKTGNPREQFSHLTDAIRSVIAKRNVTYEPVSCSKSSDILIGVPDPVFAIDKKGHVIAWNQAMEELTGVRSPDIMGKGEYEYAIPLYGFRRPLLVDLLTETDDTISQYYPGFIRTDSVITAITYILSPKENRIAFIKAALLKDGSGETIGAIEIVHDITRIPRSGYVHHGTTGTCRNIVDLIPESILLLDITGTILFINQSGHLLIEEPDPGTIYGKKSLLDYVHHDFLEKAIGDMHQAVLESDGYPSRYKLISATSREFWVESQVRKIPYQYSEAILVSMREVTIRKQAEDALRESEEKYRSLAELLPLMIFEVNRDLRVTYTNRFGLALTGTDPEEIGQDIFALSLIHPSCHHRIRENIQKQLSGLRVGTDEYTAVRKDGSTFPITIYSSPKYRDGRYDGFRGVIIDISEQKAIETRLMESEQKFRVLIEQSLDGIIIADFSGNLLFLNPRIGEIIRHPAVTELAGTANIFSFISPEHHHRVVADFTEVQAGKDGYLVQYPVNTVDGNEIWVECIGKLILYAGAPAILLSIHDITERKQTEDALRTSEERLSTIFRDNPVALTVVSAETGVFIDINTAFVRGIGYSREEIIGSTAEKLGLFPDHATYQEMLTLLRDKKHLNGFEITCRIASGKSRVIRFFSNITMMKGKPYILSSIEDITERKVARESFDALVRMMVGTTGLNALQKITSNISSWLKADCVMVGEIEPDHTTVRVLSMMLDGKEVPDFRYTLKGTPCENVRQKGYCTYSDNVSELFPDSPDLIAMKIRGYIGTPLRNSQGSVFGVMCILFRYPIQPTSSIREILDIIAVKAAAEIERTQIEQDLSKSQFLLREAMNLANLVNWEYDVISDRFIFNDRFYSLYGTTAEAEGGYRMSSGTYAQEFIHPEDRHLVYEEIEKSVNTQDPSFVSSLDHRIIRRDGDIRRVLTKIGIVKDAAGKTIKTYGANQDITELKQAEEAIRRAHRQLNLLTSITRHDILNKLSIIKGALALSEDEPVDPVVDNYFQLIRKATGDIQSQIEFTRVYENIGSEKPIWQTINAVMPYDALPPSVQLTVECGDLSVYADPMLEKVFFNLLDNSLRHGEHVTQVRVYSEIRGGEQVIVWEDNGVGILPEEKELIFERGFGRNTGYGMFLIREILSLTGISIHETGTPGTGVRFEITIPREGYRKGESGSSKPGR